MVELGLEVFLKSSHKKFRKLRVGVVCNQASVDRRLRHISELIIDSKLKLDVACFFGPQHGIRGEKQDNMIESDDFIDPLTGLPVISLYGKTREPPNAVIQPLDALIIDLQDIGTRIYTFIYTMANCMRVAKRLGKKIIVLDRPNPINGVTLEGNVLEPEYTSFVGQFPLPTRHGMTIGELAQWFNDQGIACDLEVVRMRGWDRKSYWDNLKRDWVPPSPNIPTLLSACVFPGTVHFEGTNVSEGRGTTRPFEWVGAPYVNADALAAEMNRLNLKGVFFRPHYFQPTYQKCKEEVCGGIQIHILNRNIFNSFKCGIYLLSKFYEQGTRGFQWKHPPYEYEFDRMPIDLIAGTSQLRETIERGMSMRQFEKEIASQLDKFRKVRKDYLLY